MEIIKIMITVVANIGNKKHFSKMNVVNIRSYAPIGHFLKKGIAFSALTYIFFEARCSKYNFQVSFGYLKNPGATAKITIQKTINRTRKPFLLVRATNIRNASTFAFNFIYFPLFSGINSHII